MRVQISLIPASLFLCGVFAGTCLAQNERLHAKSSVAFLHVNVIPLDREIVLRDQTVVVEGDTIHAIGPATSIQIPKDALRIDARGQYLIPGLTDAHVHLETPIEFSVYLANGVTTVFNLSGRPAHLVWRKQIAAGERLGPTIFTTGPIFTDPHKPEEAIRMVDEQAALGYDAVKIYNAVSREEYPALIAEAKKKNMLLIGHVARKPDFELTLSSGQSIAHLEEYTYTFFNPQRDGNNAHIVYDDSKIPQAVELTVKAGIFVTPTLSTYATIVQQATDLPTFLKNPELRYDAPWLQAALQPTTNRYKNGFTPSFYPRIQASLALQRKLVKALADAKVPLLCGTDASDVGPVAGFGIHDELREFVSDGLTPFEALQTATVNPARYFGRSGEFGAVKDGQRADLVLLRGNPLENIDNTRKIAGVMVRGKWFSREELNRTLEGVPGRYLGEIKHLQVQLESNPEQALKALQEEDPLDRLSASVLTKIATEQGIGKVQGILRNLRTLRPEPGLASEESVNSLGYTLLGQKMDAEAVKMFRMNTEDFPNSANTWDSLGEALFNSGDTAQAVECYKKALAVNPGYPNAEVARKFVEEHGGASK